LISFFSVFYWFLHLFGRVEDRKRA